LFLLVALFCLLMVLLDFEFDQNEQPQPDIDDLLIKT